MPWGFRLQRALLLLLIFALTALSFPNAALAAPNRAVTVTFDVVGVKAGESVTIRTRGFPIRTQFSVLMDKVGKKGVGGKPVSEFNSDKGGIIEMTLPIPEALKEEIILALRIESKDGYAGYNWFFNEYMPYKPAEASKIMPQLAFSAVKKNTSVTVEGKNLAPSTSFAVRVGPYYSFYRDYVFTERVTTDASGAVKFDLPLPKNVLDANYIMVRLDAHGSFVYNTVENVDSGKAFTDAALYRVVECQVVNITPVATLAPGEEFDVVWTVQNTGLADWDHHHVIFHYLGGERMHKYADKHTLPWTIARGKLFDFALDMIAPQTAGWHSTSWLVEQVANGQKNLCKLSVSVFVKE